ncbi:DUF2568 domain-containing protein [Streptomyces parvulus]|uniref:DUF2568 domain-containing protein n=1 Tax=Streptomyces parvulus TaxID=146923 RepID=UPI0033C3E3DB
MSGPDPFAGGRRPARRRRALGSVRGPEGRYAIPHAARLGVKAVVFGAAALALLALGHRWPALWFAVAVLVNTALASYYRTRS